MLKEIIAAIESYFRAHQFISKHRLWKWIIIPGILYMVLFVVGMYFFWTSSDGVVSWFTHWLGIDKWLQRVNNRFLSFLFLMGEMMVRLLMVFFYFSFFTLILRHK